MPETPQPGTPQPEAPQLSPIERQLNLGLMVVMVIAALIVVYGVVYVVASGQERADRPQFEALQIALVFLVLPGTVVFFTARTARRRLRAQAASAKLFAVLTGIFAMVAGLPLLSTVFGLVVLVAGLFTLTAAILLKKDQLR